MDRYLLITVYFFRWKNPLYEHEHILGQLPEDVRYVSEGVKVGITY